ncbi:hypothetical protein Daus18300_011334 [Diaporthe australafricana]|uniref:Uncharacterized protein n=1 Tax=Diaporthe australafricana TaxID=127596 RepID=A0ABR3W721_9PEZI
MPRSGILMRLTQHQPGQTPSDAALRPPNLCPGIEATYNLKATDERTPEYNTLYFLSDIDSVLTNDSLYEADVQAHTSDFASLLWVVASFINGRGKGDSAANTTIHTPLALPAHGTIIVANGSTPLPEKEYDYHAWYDEEHAGKLGHVPGWQLSRRYKFERLYGEAEVASFYGVNFYDEINGLGGPEWKAAVTDWTLRIRDQAAKPNVRRTWKVVSTLMDDVADTAEIRGG